MKNRTEGPSEPGKSTSTPSVTDHKEEVVDELRERIAEIVYDEYRVGRMPDYQPMWHTLEHKPAAMLRAADRILAVVGEPVAWRVRNSPDVGWVYHEDQYGPGEMARILGEITPEGGEIVPLYALTSGSDE